MRCVRLCARIQRVCVCGRGFWCARIKPSRSKNTYVQGWNSIMPVLCENPRQAENCLWTCCRTKCKNYKYYQSLVKLFPGPAALTKRQEAKYLDFPLCQTKLIFVFFQTGFSKSLSVFLFSCGDAPGCTYTTSPPPASAPLPSVTLPLFACFTPFCPELPAPLWTPSSRPVGESLALSFSGKIGSWNPFACVMNYVFPPR